MKTHMAIEDYLEAMLMAKEKNGYIRSKDVAEELSVTKPSVSYITKKLRDDGYITMNANRNIELTDSGMAIAQKIYNRHKVLTRLFTELGVDPATARDDACKIEHDLSESTFNAIVKFTEKLEAK